MRLKSFVSVTLATTACGTFLACDEPGGGSAPIGDAVFDGAGDTSGGDSAPDDTTTATSGDTTLGDGTANDTSGPADTVEGPPPITSPTCIDGQFDEVPPDDGADISGLLAGYPQAGYLDFVDALLAARYPLGQFIVASANENGAGGLGNCITAYTSNRASARALMGDISTVVHECGHIFDLDSASFSSDFYFINHDVTWSCSRGDTTTRGGDTFARSRLNGDAFSADLPGDFYRDVYLDGDPDDGAFDSGDQGFNSVLEEATQYINTLVTEWALRDQSPSVATSARDGILTFLWYIERYLALARTDFPSAYTRLSTDPCWRRAILTVWGRAWFYLDLTAGIRSLGIDDATIEALVVDTSLLAEIDRLRDLEGCR